MPKAVLFIASVALFVPSVLAQQRPIPGKPGFVHLKNGTIPIRRNISNASLRKDALAPVHFQRHYYVLAQFDSLPDSSRRVAMAAEGLHLYDYVSDHTYLAELQDSFDLPTLKGYQLAGVFALPTRSKLSSGLQNDPNQEIHSPDKLLAIGYFGTTPESEIRRGITAAGASIETVKFQPPRVIFARLSDTATLRRLTALPYVSYLTSQPVRPRALNYNNRAAQGADALSASSGHGLYGDGVVVGIGDDADPSSHVDFTGRLIVRTPAPQNNHGTHTTGSVAGGGIINPMYQGMAPHATVISQFFSDILANAPIYVSDYDMLLTNNSYTDYNYGCVDDGQYDALAYATDAQLDTYSTLMHVFASGNDGDLTCTPYPYKYATVKSGFQCAKNVIAVGNIDNTNGSGSNVYTIEHASSSGPTADGRIKPELVAGGTGVTSTTPGNTYGTETGTSMSSPDVTGTLALLAQRYRQLYHADPPGVILKTVACISATDLGNPGPDYYYGFGALNGLAADQILENHYFTTGQRSNGQSGNLTLSGIPAGAAQLRVMICWNDYPAAPYAATTLVNNLDLKVTAPGGVVHHPLILDPTPANVGNTAVEGVDNLNNIEEVVINNPPAGNYTINITGTSIPYGPQPFALAYMLVQPGITMQYPYGNETWVPGNPEIIRWNATDGGTNPFTIDYSADNGATWTTISNSVPGNNQLYNWTAPATATNQALIRVSRNSTAYSGTSAYPFVILGQPTVTGSSPCQGYAQLSWGAIPAATSYDIMQLVGDTMVKVASTTSTAYLLGNLNRDSSYWLGVRAVNGSTPGRRSISVNILPMSGGACNLGALDNDYTVDSSIALTSGRLYTSTQLSASTPIHVEVRNLGTAATGASYTLNYSINGGTPVTETTSANVPANGGAFNYTFTTPANLSAQGTYTIRTWVSYPGDPQQGNDTLTTVVRQLSNTALTLSPSFTEGLESAAVGTYASTTTGFSGLDRCDFSASSTLGRTRTYVDQGMCRTGNRCAILDQAPVATVSTADSLIMTFNLSNYGASDQLWLDFYYRNQGSDSLYGASKVWIRGNDQAAWIQVQVLDTSAANIGIYQPSQHIDITGTLQSAVPAQTVSSSFQIKFGEQGYTSANDVYTDGTVDDGYIFDDITLSRSANDLGVTRLLSPLPGNQCALTNATPVSIVVRNYTSATVTNIPVSYTVNGVIVNETIPSLNGDDSTVYTFATPADLSAYRTYSIRAMVSYPGDTYASNDTVGPDTLHTSPVIATFPYLEGFETSDGSWFTGGQNSSWQWGAPTKTIINQAAGGNNCWVTSLTGDYNNNELSYLYSPCFDLSSLSRPVLSFSHIFQTEDDCDCDYHWVEYSTNDTTWTKLGAVGNGTNWYDNAIRQAWQLSSTKWHVSSYDIPTSLTTAPKVRFRIVMNSDPATTFEGVGIDDIHLFDKASVYSGADDSLAQPVSGSGWINFDLGGGRVAAINANGQDLGMTNVKVFFNHGDTVRHDQTQYYLDRNIVIQPSKEPSGNVTVRFYFLDSEADTLIGATGCATCATIPNAYQSGVTQFSSPQAFAEEDSTLANDSIGAFNFHAPRTDVSIIPNDNGYYAQYNVNGFSEFWINAVAPTDSAAIPPTTLVFTATQAGNGALLQWTTTNSFGISRFIIQKSTDSLHFSVLDSLPALLNGSGVENYAYTDPQLDSGYNYYRLEEVMTNGTIFYSIVRVVQGPSGGGGVGVYPNPVIRHTALYVRSATVTERIRMIDAAGREVRNQEVRGNQNVIPIGNLAPGIYFVEVVTDSGTSVQKILVK